MEVLPNDLVRQCLLRVPYNSHDNLKSVCRSWEAMVSSPKFYEDRKISGTTQRLLCLLQRNVFVIKIYDPVNGIWERLPLPDFHFAGKPKYFECVAVNRKLVLMVALPRTIVMKRVYIYDFESARWSRGADMPTARYSFACSVDSSTGLVYVAGGVGTRPLAAAEAYNVEEDKWEILPPMIQPHGECHGVFMEGKFMVLSIRQRCRSFRAECGDVENVGRYECQGMDKVCGFFWGVVHFQL